MTTKTENEVPENDVDHKAPPSKSEYYDLPAIYFSAKFLKFIRIASARAKNTCFRSFEGFQGRWHKSGAFGPQHLPPFLFSWCFQPFYVWGGGGGLCLFISRHRLFAPIRLVCCFSSCFLFVFFSFIVSFFLLLLLCSSKEKEEEKGKQDEWKNDKQQKIKKANQGDKGGIARKNVKHKDKETQQRREAKQETKKQTFCCSCRFGLLASLWAKSCQGERAKKHYETRVFVVFFFLFVGVLLGKLTKRTITRTKLRRQDNKTTRQQKTIQEQKQQQ